MLKTDLRVGPAQFTRGGLITIGRYINGEIALSIESLSGEKEAVATVCLVDYTDDIIGPFKVWLKGWSENAGIPEAMRAAGHVVLTGVTMPLQHDAKAIEARLFGELRAIVAKSVQPWEYPHGRVQL